MQVIPSTAALLVTLRCIALCRPVKMADMHIYARMSCSYTYQVFEACTVTHIADLVTTVVLMPPTACSVHLQEQSKASTCKNTQYSELIMLGFQLP